MSSLMAMRNGLMALVIDGLPSFFLSFGGAPLGASPESISQQSRQHDGFRARR
jgi:hypothetical protein